ncbi:hypothetical protein [uncultured Treponema sp.]|uniref:hypothetical protein n=1 Tax=uncultured Treponema sp. TaxID=162155 RepID=UPI0025D8F009|nr:hypothetical protein [uncultured Treponema sp.]
MSKKPWIFAIFSSLFAVSLFFTACDNGSNDDSTTETKVPIIPEANVTGYDDWDDLTDMNWFIGKWNCTASQILNMTGAGDFINQSASVNFEVTGTNTNDSVILSESSDTSIIKNGTVTYAQFEQLYKEAYSDSVFDTAIDELKNHGVKITSIKNRKVYRKVSPDRTRIELYKSIIISGIADGESGTLTTQVKESFKKIGQNNGSSGGNGDNQNNDSNSSSDTGSTDNSESNTGTDNGNNTNTNDTNTETNTEDNNPPSSNEDFIKTGIFWSEGSDSVLEPVDGVYSASFKKVPEIWSECTSIPLVFDGKPDTNYKISYKFRTNRNAISLHQPRTIFSDGVTAFFKTTKDEWTDISVYTGTFKEGFSMLRLETAMETTEESVDIQIKDIEISETTEKTPPVNLWKTGEFLTEKDLSVTGTDEEFTIKFKSATADKWQQTGKIMNLSIEKGSFYKVSYTMNVKNATSKLTANININDLEQKPEYTWAWSEPWLLEAGVDTEVITFIYANKDVDYLNRVKPFSEYEKGDLNKNPCLKIGIHDAIPNEITVKNIHAEKVSVEELKQTMAIMWVSDYVENEPATESYTKKFDDDNKFTFTVPAGYSVYGRPLLTKLSTADTNPWDDTVLDNKLILKTYIIWDFEEPEKLSICAADKGYTDKLKFTNNGAVDLEVTASINEDGKFHIEAK